MERLGLDRLDIVYLHDPDEHWTEVLATGYAALEELRSDGIVGAIGAGMNQSTMLADLVRETDLDVVMLAGRYTLLEQDALDDLLPLCCERRVAVVAAGVFNSGLLARERPSNDAKYDYGEAPDDSSSARRRSPHLRAAWDDASSRRSRVSARPPSGRKCLRRRTIGGANVAKRGALRRAHRFRPVERAQGEGPPPQ